MSLSDPIGDMIARVKNAQSRNHKKVNYQIQILKQNCQYIKKWGFIKDFKVQSETNKSILSLEQIPLRQSSDKCFWEGVKTW